MQDIRLAPLDRAALVELLRSKPVCDWEKAIEILENRNLLFLPSNHYEARGLEKPALSDEDKARRLKGHLNRMADQKRAKELRKERRRVAHEKRMEEMKAASEKRKKNRAAHLETNKSTMTFEKWEKEGGRGRPSYHILRYQRACVKEITENWAESDHRSDFEGFVAQLPNHYLGRAWGPRWQARPPKRSFWNENFGSEEGEEAEKTYGRLCLFYNLTNKALSEHYHEATGFVAANEVKRSGREKSKAKTYAEAVSKTSAGVERVAIL